MKFIDLNQQFKLNQKKIEQAIGDVIASGDFILGEQVEILEDNLKKYTETNCITVGNGTDAILVVLRALDIKEGDEIIVPSFTWVSTAEVVKLVGATPIFCDICSKTFNMDVNDLKNSLTERTKAIIAVSIFGQCANLELISKIGKKNNIVIIEDAAQSFGAEHFGNKSCSIADFSTTSFFPSKPLGCYGDGGAIFYKDKSYEKKIRSIPRHGQEGRYNYVEVGLNSRLDTIQAAILNAKLSFFDDEINTKQQIAKRYEHYLSSIEEIELPFIEDFNRSVYALYTVKLNKNFDRREVIEFLGSRGIPTGLYYPVPLHKSKPYLSNKKLPVTNDCSERVFSLPMHPYLTENDIEEISRLLKIFFKS